MDAKHAFKMPGIAVATVVVALMLDAIGRLLSTYTGYGIESLLGGLGTDAAGELVHIWTGRFQEFALPLAGAYLLLDTIWFMPLYGVLFLALWQVARDSLLQHSARSGDWALWLVHIGAGLVLSLWLLDGLENMVGLAVVIRQGDEWPGALAAAAAALLFGLCGAALWRTKGDRPWLRGLLARALPPWPICRRTLWPWLCLLLPVLLLMSWLLWGPVLGVGPATPTCAKQVGWAAAACQAHGFKHRLALALLGVPAALAVWVLFGPHADEARWWEFVPLRRALFSLLARCRYVLIALVAAAALLVVLDQGRDVIYALASHPWDAQGQLRLERSLTTVLALLITAFAIWMLGFCCWLWSRVVLQISTRQGDPAEAGVAVAAKVSAVDRLARDAARLLGIVPALLVVVLTLQTLQGAAHMAALPAGPRDGAFARIGPIVVLVFFAVLVMSVMVAFVWRRDRLAGPNQAGGYFNALDLRQVLSQLDSRSAAHVRFRLFGLVRARHLPALAIAGALLLRLLLALQEGAGPWPSLALPIVLLEVCFWLSMVGWLSLLEQHEAIPWYLFIIVAIGALGLVGVTENHRVNTVAAGLPLPMPTSVGLSALVAALLVAGFSMLRWQMLRERPRPSQPGGRSPLWPPSPQAASWTLLGLLMAGSVLGLLLLDRLLPEVPATPPAEIVPDAVAPEAALGRWLAALPTDGKPAYIVAAEGGGIRSAYWTALALAEVSEREGPAFESRVFAMVGVSGGAVGLAAFRACQLRVDAAAPPTKEARAEALAACVDRLGQADLLTPLVGAWFFEDAIGRIVPTSWCRHPGCGLMSRGLWFEQGLVQSLPELRLGLLASRQRRLAQRAGQHTPYLMLNATWVETGERTIASEIAIDPQRFPGARDQLALLVGTADLPLAVAAHNSARFPFTNALGGVQAAPERCTSDAMQWRKASAAARQPERCGHLADGGYFENAGAHTAADLVRLVRACLQESTEQDSVPACPGLGRQARAALRARLDLRVLLIRNGVRADEASAARAACRPPAWPTAADISPPPLPPDRMIAALRRPACAGNASLFADSLGPAIAAFNAIGTGANGRLAAARPGDEADELARVLAHPGPGGSRAVPVDLFEDGPLFPLGWHLSPTAQRLMVERARQIRLP